MDFKINVFGPDGVELTPCTLEKARELCEKGKAELINNGTAIRLFEAPLSQVSVNRIKQQNALLTTKNIFEYNLRRIEVQGKAGSGKTHFVLHAAKALPTVGSSTYNRINTIFYIYKTEELKQAFFKALENLYRGVGTNKSFISVDYEPSIGVYYVNRNDVYSHLDHPVKSNLCLFVPVKDVDTENPAFYGNIRGNYAVLMDDVVEPKGPIFQKFLAEATLAIKTTTVESVEEVKLLVHYK